MNGTSPLKPAVERLLAEAQVGAPGSMKPLVQVVLDLGRNAPKEQLTEAVAALGDALDPEYAQTSGWLALTAGSIVEWGVDGTALGHRLIEHLPMVIRQATEFGEKAVASALSPEESAQVKDESAGEWLGNRFLTHEQAAALADQDFDGNDAWAAIPFWFMPAVACFSRDQALRRRAGAAIPPFPRLAELKAEAKFLAVLLAVLDDEPFLVFHPSTLLGFRLRLSGVAGNFQLHTLLADTLIKPAPTGLFVRLRASPPSLPGTRPHPTVAAVARGDGPQQSSVPSAGLWDMYQWTALQPDGTLPHKVPQNHWIWGEGVPADIRPFEGSRVILLGPPSYRRSWNTGRSFESLRASIIVEETFSSPATQNWLRRLGRAAAQ